MGDCEVGQDDRPICRCKPTYIGNPLQGCRHECDSDGECGQSQTCDRQHYRCESACGNGVCGENANCQAVNHRAQYTCPPDFLGDPFTRCYTECTRHNDCASDKPVCTCPAGFRGDPLTRCSRGECINDSECRLDQACFDYNCRSPGQDACGQNAECQARNHGAIC